MAPESIQQETKSVLTPEAMVQLLYRLHGGSFTPSASPARIDDLHAPRQFPLGALGKEAKLQASREGNVLVQTSVVATSNDARVLLSMRTAPHLVTAGGSILTSGDPRLPPSEVFLQKVAVRPVPERDAYQRIGVGLSSLEQTGGIRYAFDIYRVQLDAHNRISSLTGDHVQLVTWEEAAAALQGKPLELSLLQYIAP